MDFELTTPTVTRSEFKLSPVPPCCKKALKRELTDNDLLLLNLPEVPFVGEGERLNQSCPFDLDDDDDDSEEEIDPFQQSWTPKSTSDFLRPRTAPTQVKQKSLFSASLSRMVDQGRTKMAFHQSFRLPKKTMLPMIPESAAKDADSTSTTRVGLGKKPLRRLNSATCA